MRRQVLISRPLQKLLVDPVMVVRQERAAPALWSVQVMRLVAVVHHHEIPLLHETHRPGDPAWGGQTDVRFLPRLQGDLRFGEKTLERRSRQRQKRFVELAVAQHDVDFPRTLRGPDHPVHREGVQDLVGEEAADERGTAVECLLVHPGQRDRGAPLQPRALALLERPARLDQEVTQGCGERSVPRRLAQEVGREVPLARPELDEVPGIGPSGATPHLLGLARQESSERGVDSAARDVVAPAPSSDASRVVPEHGVVQAHLHETCEGNRSAGRDLRGDLRLQACARVVDGHRSGRRGRRERASGCFRPATLPRAPLNESLDLHDPFDQRLGTGRAAGDVDIHRDDLVDPLDDRIGAEHASG